MLIILGYIAALIMGMTLGLIGAGGSILTVPILVYLLDVQPVTATGYSLLIVGLTALIGGISYYRKNLVDIQTTIIFALPSLVAVYLTRLFLVPAIPDTVFTISDFILTKDVFILILFASLMLIAGITMILNGSTITTKKNYPLTKRILLTGSEGAIIGVFTGMVGAGGGFLIIPALVLLAGLDIKIAVGSSLLIIAAKSLIGFIGDLQAGIELDAQLLILFIACTISGMIMGTKLSHHIKDSKLKKAFGIFTLLIGIIILIKEL